MQLRKIGRRWRALVPKQLSATDRNGYTYNSTEDDSVRIVVWRGQSKFFAYESIERLRLEKFPNSVTVSQTKRGANVLGSGRYFQTLINPKSANKDGRRIDYIGFVAVNAKASQHGTVQIEFYKGGILSDDLIWQILESVQLCISGID